METTAVQSAVTQITGALTDLSSTNMLAIVVGALGITVGLCVVWFGVRYITRKVMKAFKSGRA